MCGSQVRLWRSTAASPLPNRPPTESPLTEEETRDQRTGVQIHKSELNPDAWNRNPSLQPSCDWLELFTDFLPPFPGSAKPSHSHRAENIPDSWENRPEGPYCHHLNGGQITQHSQKNALGGGRFTHAFLLPVCASYDFEKKTKVDLVVGGVGGERKKCLFCLGFSQFLQMQQGLRLSLKAALSSDICFITQGNLPFWERIRGLGIVRASVHRWRQVREGSGITEESAMPEVSWPWAPGAPRQT